MDFETRKLSIHDSLLTGYSVDGVSKTMVLHTEPFSGGGDAFVDVIFHGVAAYRFENDLLQNIVFDIEETSAEETEVIARTIEAEEGRWGWPRDWDPRSETVLQCFKRLGVKVFQLGSSYGMTGWVAAQSMAEIVRLTPAHVSAPDPVAHSAIREALLRAWDPLGVADAPEAAEEYDAYVPAIYRMLNLRADAEQLADYLGRVQTEAMRLPASVDTLESVAEELLALKLPVSVDAS